MCGVAGILQRKPSLPRDALLDAAGRMADTLAHRGPDGRGVWADAEQGVALGHRRLSIQDLSEAGRQPMVSACGRYVVSYNGEIYDFRALRSELEGYGQPFVGHSDTEVLLAAISEWGLDAALPRLHGMFAFALWDRRERALFLVRDRVGKKPLYYGWCGGSFLFGSELKALQVHPEFEHEIDRDALGLLLQQGWIPAPHSIFRGIRKLPAGHVLRVTSGGTSGLRTGSLRPDAYWSAPEAARRAAAEPFPGSFDEATDALEVRLREAVSRRMVADVDLGALLSGGIDSSMIVALMQAQSSRPIRTFSIGFEEPDYDEAPYARAVAAHLGSEHTELIVSHRETRDVIPTLPTLFDEPFADASQIPTWIVSQMTRRHVTVALSGDGGDELFAGYNRYYRALKEWDRWRRAPRALRSAAAIGLHAVARAGWRTLGPGHSGALEPLPGWRRYLGKLEKTLRSMPAESLADLYARMSARCGPARELVVGAQSGSRPQGDEAVRTALDDPMRRLMLIDFCGYLADDILVKVDRASMSVGLEVRAPFLDQRVVELAWSFPTAFSVEPGARKGKRVLRELLGRHVPRELFERRKQGFGVPIGEWLHGPLRGWAEDLLSSERLAQQGILRPEAVQRVWRQHLSGWANHDNLLWSLLMFEAWVDGREPPKHLQPGIRQDATATWDPSSAGASIPSG